MRFYEAILQFNQWRVLKVRRIDGYDLDLRQFCIFVKNKNIEDVSIEEITEWIGWYKSLGFESWTVLKKAMALRKFFEYYGRLKYDVVDFWLIPLPPKTFKLPHICSQDEYNSLLNAIPKKTRNYYHIRNRCLITLIWNTGIRISEATNLNIEDVEIENREIIVKTEKSRGMTPFRKLPYNRDVERNLITWLKYRKNICIQTSTETNALFIGIDSGNISKFVKARRLAGPAAGEVFRKYSKLAKIPCVNAHSLRHHFGRELSKENFNQSLISDALGHSSLQSSRIYTVLESRDLSTILRKRLK